MLRVVGEVPTGAIWSFCDVPTGAIWSVCDVRTGASWSVCQNSRGWIQVSDNDRGGFGATARHSPDTGAMPGTSFKSRNSSVVIATRYMLDGPGIESRQRRDFTHRSRPALGPTQPPMQCLPGKAPGRGVNHSLSSSTKLKKKDELCLYPLSGSSWPVLGRTLPFYVRLYFSRSPRACRDSS